MTEVTTEAHCLEKVLEKIEARLENKIEQFNNVHIRMQNLLEKFEILAFQNGS
eukprot:Pgem_evm1s17223